VKKLFIITIFIISSLICFTHSVKAETLNIPANPNSKIFTTEDNLQSFSFDLSLIPLNSEINSMKVLYYHEATSNATLQIININNSEVLETKSLLISGEKTSIDLKEKYPNWSKVKDVPILVFQVIGLSDNILVNNIGLVVDYLVLDSTTPSFLSASILETNPTSVNIGWETDESGIATIEYGKTTKYEDFILVGEVEIENEFLLENLRPGITYHLQISISDSSGNIGKSNNLTFTTPINNNNSSKDEFFTVDTNTLTPPVLTLLEQIPESNNNSVKINWQYLNGNSLDGFILYKSIDNGLTYQEIQRFESTTTFFVDPDILGDTRYTYAIRGFKGNEQTILSDELSIFVYTYPNSNNSVSASDLSLQKALIFYFAVSTIVLILTIFVTKWFKNRFRKSDTKKSSKYYNVLKDPDYYKD